MYHSIDDSGSSISLDASAFERHVRWLSESSVRVVPMTEIARAPEDEDTVALTFDDGFANFESEAWPRLREAGLPASLFVVTERVGTTNAWGGRTVSGIPDLPLLDWNALGRLAEQGVDLGAHSRTHRSLPGLSTAELEDEVLGSKRTLAERIGTEPVTFAYPYGDWNDACADVAERNFVAACTTELRILEESDRRSLLPRLDAYYFGRAGTLESWGSLAFRARLRVRAALRNAKSAVLKRG